MTLRWTAATLIYMFVPMCGFSSSEQTQKQFSPICRSLTVLFLLDQLIVLLFYASLLICGGFSPIMFCAAAPCSCVLWHIHLHSSISTPSHIITLLFITGWSKQKKLKVSLLFFFLGFHHFFILHSDFNFYFITSCQCPTLTTWLWMKIILDPGGCRISGGK